MSPPSPTPEYAALFNCDAVRDIEEETIAIMFRDSDSRGDVGARAHHMLINLSRFPLPHPHSATRCVFHSVVLSSFSAVLR